MLIIILLVRLPAMLISEVAGCPPTSEHADTINDIVNRYQDAIFPRFPNYTLPSISIYHCILILADKPEAESIGEPHYTFSNTLHI